MSNLFRLFLAGLVMSFAWPVRGQFGHEWGATICGALATVIVCAFVTTPQWRKAFAQAVPFGIIGFSFGGAFGYGSLVDEIMNAPSLSSVVPQLVHVFLIGGVWGGLGMTLMAYGLTELNQRFKEAVILTAFAVAAYLISDALPSLQGLFVLAAAFLFIYAFALFMQRSGMINLFGFFGFFGFGLGFLVSVIILWYGNHGYLPGNWWSLRDQIWGFIGGLSVYLALIAAIAKRYAPVPVASVPLRRFGFIAFMGFVPGWNCWDVYQKWFTSDPVITNEPLAAGLWIFVNVLLLGWVGFAVYAKADFLEEPKLNTVLLLVSLFFCLVLGFMAIMKSIGYSGMSVWETGFTLIVIDLVLFALSFPLIFTNSVNE